jgi:N-acetylglucosaminyl-diphospho-decaprenol L-rhamnosyltransferase
MNRITALIVTYNSADHIAACVNAALTYCAEVLVVDNASTDATLATIPKGARVIVNPRNQGFAGGVNVGMNEAGFDTVLLLNPDAVLLDDPAPLVREDAAVAAGLLVDAAGHAQTGFSVRRFPTPAALVFEALGLNWLWPSNLVNRRYRALDLDLTRAQDVEQPAGAFLLIRRDAWRAVGGFDERFHPVWFEDVDFLKQIHHLGLRIRFVPSVRAEHAGGHSVNRLEAPLRTGYWYGSLFKYAGKHFSPAGRRAVALAVIAGVGARWAISILRGASGSAQGWRQAIMLAIRSFG